jgi:hypothetical protein
MEMASLLTASGTIPPLRRRGCSGGGGAGVGCAAESGERRAGGQARRKAGPLGMAKRRSFAMRRSCMRPAQGPRCPRPARTWRSPGWVRGSGAGARGAAPRPAARGPAGAGGTGTTGLGRLRRAVVDEQLWRSPSLPIFVVERLGRAVRRARRRASLRRARRCDRGPCGEHAGRPRAAGSIGGTAAGYGAPAPRGVSRTRSWSRPRPREAIETGFPTTWDAACAPARSVRASPAPTPRGVQQQQQQQRVARPPRPAHLGAGGSSTLAAALPEARAATRRARAPGARRGGPTRSGVGGGPGRPPSAWEWQVPGSAEGPEPIGGQAGGRRARSTRARDRRMRAGTTLARRPRAHAPAGGAVRVAPARRIDGSARARRPRHD